jgi:hypothetical protein
MVAQARHNRYRFDCLDQLSQDNLLDGLLRLKASLRAQLAGEGSEEPTRQSAAQG